MKPVELSPAQKVLLKAAELIETRGHCKNELEDEEGRLCTLGAILMAEHETTAACFNNLAVARRLYGQVSDVVTFNNAPSTTPQMVIDLLRAAAMDEVER